MSLDISVIVSPDSNSSTPYLPLSGEPVRVKASNSKISLMDKALWNKVLKEKLGAAEEYLEMLDDKARAQCIALKITGIAWVIMLGGGLLIAGTQGGRKSGEIYFSAWCVMTFCLILGVVVKKREFWIELSEHTNLTKVLRSTQKIFEPSNVRSEPCFEWIKEIYGRYDLSYAELLSGFKKYNDYEKKQMKLLKKKETEMRAQQEALLELEALNLDGNGIVLTSETKLLTDPENKVTNKG